MDTKAAGWNAAQVSTGLCHAGYAAETVGNVSEDVWEEARDWCCDDVGRPFC